MTSATAHANLVEVIRQLAASPTRAPIDPSYLDALHQYWAMNYEGAVDAASRVVAASMEDDDHGEAEDVATTFAAYRLWIEALAARNEHGALRSLRDHLFLRGQAEPGMQATWAALRGLVHLELDEFGAARLLARSMADFDHNPYCLELVQLVDARVEHGPAGMPALLRSTTPITDYCHWQTLARGLLRASEKTALNETLTQAQDRFRGAPIMKLFGYHAEIESGNFAAAALLASRLVESYPRTPDYRYYQAYAMFEDGDYPAARRSLTECLADVGEEDAEVVGLLGHCYAKMGEPEKAAHFLRQAVATLKAQGLPTSHVSLELSNVEDEMRGDALDPAVEMPREPHNWLLTVSPRRCHELLTGSEATVDRLIRPMGDKPRKGDFCFFAAEERQSGKQEGVWKIIAVYAVDSDPIWHPVHGHHTALKLVTRVPSGVIVDVRFTDGEEGVSGIDGSEVARLAKRFGVKDAMKLSGRRLALPKGDGFHQGVYQVDSGVLDLIERAAQLRPDELIERRRNAQARRPTA